MSLIKLANPAKTNSVGERLVDSGGLRPKNASAGKHRGRYNSV